MDLATLSNTAGARHRRKRVGRGMASGHGKTSGRGHKGQMAHKGHKHKLGFEGGQMPLLRRLPKRGFKNPGRVPIQVINVGDLATFAAGTEVGVAQLAVAGLVRMTDQAVKVLGNGELTHKLTVKASAFSAAAKAKIEAAGGTCETV
jgi:large subunit ribosomal protein L15